MLGSHPLLRAPSPGAGTRLPTRAQRHEREMVPGCPPARWEVRLERLGEGAVAGSPGSVPAGLVPLARPTPDTLPPRPEARTPSQVAPRAVAGCMPRLAAPLPGRTFPQLPASPRGPGAVGPRAGAFLRSPGGGDRRAVRVARRTLNL